MSAAKIVQEKENKFFKRGDIIVYVVLALLIVSLFLIVFLPKSKDQISAFKMEYNGIEVLEYNFDSDSYRINPEYVTFEKESQTMYKFTFKEGKDSKEYNIIKVDLTMRQITCEEANCSISKDCTHMKISKMGDTIICIPHRLFITPVGSGEIQDPIIG